MKREQKPKWYFYLNGSIISVRARHKVTAYRRARRIVGLA